MFLCSIITVSQTSWYALVRLLLPVSTSLWIPAHFCTHFIRLFWAQICCSSQRKLDRVQRIPLLFWIYRHLKNFDADQRNRKPRGRWSDHVAQEHQSSPLSLPFCTYWCCMFGRERTYSAHAGDGLSKQMHTTNTALPPALLCVVSFYPQCIFIPPLSALRRPVKFWNKGALYVFYLLCCYDCWIWRICVWSVRPLTSDTGLSQTLLLNDLQSHDEWQVWGANDVFKLVKMYRLSSTSCIYRLHSVQFVSWASLFHEAY